MREADLELLKGFLQEGLNSLEATAAKREIERVISTLPRLDSGGNPRGKKTVKTAANIPFEVDPLKSSQESRIPPKERENLRRVFTAQNRIKEVIKDLESRGLAPEKIKEIKNELNKWAFNNENIPTLMNHKRERKSLQKATEALQAPLTEEEQQSGLDANAIFEARYEKTCSEISWRKIGEFEYNAMKLKDTITEGFRKTLPSAVSQGNFSRESTSTPLDPQKGDFLRSKTPTTTASKPKGVLPMATEATARDEKPTEKTTIHSKRKRTLTVHRKP